MSACVHCGQEAPPHCNYCSWDCSVDEAKAGGGKVITPNGLPIRCIMADGTMLECEGGDHPTYLFPVTVECPSCSEEYDMQMHALIYTDGCVAVTIYEYCYAMWSVRDGKAWGGNLQRKTDRLSAESLAKIAALRPEGT